MRFTKHAIVIIAVVCLCRTVSADVAISVTDGTGGTPGADTNHGWQFVANENMTVTHLGLLDLDLGGFSHDHPIGLFDASSGDLLVSGTIHAGDGDPLIENFRYIDTDDVNLTAGSEYIIAYYSASSNKDFVITNPDDFAENSAIEWLNGRWGSGGGLKIPENVTSAHRIGPNFQFVVGGGCLVKQKVKQKKCKESGCEDEAADCSIATGKQCETKGDCLKKIKQKKSCANPDEAGKCIVKQKRCRCDG